MFTLLGNSLGEKEKRKKKIIKISHETTRHAKLKGETRKKKENSQAFPISQARILNFREATYDNSIKLFLIIHTTLFLSQFSKAFFLKFKATLGKRGHFFSPKLHHIFLSNFTFAGF